MVKYAACDGMLNEIHGAHTTSRMGIKRCKVYIHMVYGIWHMDCKVYIWYKYQWQLVYSAWVLLLQTNILIRSKDIL